MGISKQSLIECDGFGEACQRFYTLLHLSYTSDEDETLAAEEDTIDVYFAVMSLLF